MHGDASRIRHNSGTQQQQAPSLNSGRKKPSSSIVQDSQTPLACLLASAPSSGPDPDNDSPNEAADDGTRMDAPPEYWGLHNSTMVTTAVSNIQTLVPFSPGYFCC